MYLRPRFPPRLDDPFWAIMAAALTLTFAVLACRFAFTTAEQREAERERLELIRDGD